VGPGDGHKRWRLRGRSRGGLTEDRRSRPNARSSSATPEPGFLISACKVNEFDVFEFDVTRDRRLDKARVERRKTLIEYRLKAGTAKPGALEIVQNHVNAIKAIAGTVLRQQTGVATLMIRKGGTETWAKVAANQVGSGNVSGRCHHLP
jgi:hypothetical protein